MLGLSKDGLVDIFQESVGEVLVPQNVLNDLGGFALDENFNIWVCRNMIFARINKYEHCNTDLSIKTIQRFP